MRMAKSMEGTDQHQTHTLAGSVGRKPSNRATHVTEISNRAGTPFRMKGRTEKRPSFHSREAVKIGQILPAENKGRCETSSQVQTPAGRQTKHRSGQSWVKNSFYTQLGSRPYEAAEDPWRRENFFLSQERQVQFSHHHHYFLKGSGQHHWCAGRTSHCTTNSLAIHINAHPRAQKWGCPSAPDFLKMRMSVRPVKKKNVDVRLPREKTKKGCPSAPWIRSTEKNQDLDANLFWKIFCRKKIFADAGFHFCWRGVKMTGVKMTGVKIMRTQKKIFEKISQKWKNTLQICPLSNHTMPDGHPKQN